MTTQSVNTNNQLTILACQINIPITADTISRDHHLDTSCKKVSKELSKQSVDLVVLPELSSIDYSRQSFENLSELSEPLDGPSFKCWRQVARQFNTSIAYSFPRRDKDKYFISLAIVDPDGDLIGYYDKIHLAQYGASMEKEYFTRGESLFIFEINGLRIAPIICYDIRIPEISRALVIDHKADLILHSGAYYRDESFYSWHPFVITRAMENQVYLVSLNRAGENYGHSIFCSPWMDENQAPKLFDEHAENFVRLQVTREVIQQSRKQYSFLEDRLEQYNLSQSQKISKK